VVGKEFIPQGVVHKLAGCHIVGLGSSLGGLVELRVGEVDGDARGTGFLGAMLFGNHRLFKCIQHPFGCLCDPAFPGCLGCQLDKMPKVNIGRRNIGAKNAGEALRIAARLGNRPLIGALEDEREVVDRIN